MCVYRSKKVVWLIIGLIYDIPKKELVVDRLGHGNKYHKSIIVFLSVLGLKEP